MAVTVTEDVDLPAGVNPRAVQVHVYLAGQDGAPLDAGYATSAGRTIVGQYRFPLPTTGAWSLALVPNGDITPSGTVWAVQLSGPGSARISQTPRFGLVPSSGPVVFESILTDPPGALTPSALAAHEAQIGVPSGHLPAQTPNNGDVPIWNAGTGHYAPGPQTGGGSGAVSSVNGQVGAVVLAASDVGAQPVDSDLTAIAALSTTAFGRAFLTLADAAAGRTALGLGSLATQNGTFSGTSSGTNTGDQDLSGLVPKTTTVNGHALSGNVSVTAADVGLGSVTNDAQLKAADLDNDTTLAANSATKIPSQHAVKVYVDTAVTGLLEFKGSTDCSANPNYPAANKGDAYVVSVAGKVGGASGKSVDIGDMYLATADNAGGTEASVGTSWTVLEHNLVGALLAGNNLSDVGSATTARTNLGLGTAAVVDTGTGAANVPTITQADARYAALLLATGTKTASYTALPWQQVPLDTTSATPIVVTLPTAPADGTVVEVGWILGANATATIVTGGSDTFIGGGTTSTLLYLYQFRRYLYRASGALWTVHNSMPISGLDARYVGLAGSTSTGQQVAPTFQASGNTGANSTPTTLTGGNASGAPASGTHVKGEIAPDYTGKLWLCTVAGTPGTWVSTAGSGGGMATDPMWNAAGDLAYASADNTGAILAYSADGKVLGAVSGLPSWVDPRSSIIAESHADSSVVNSTTETAVVSLSLSGGSVVAGDMVRLTVWGDLLNNSGSSVNYTYRFKVGTTTVMASSAFSIATSANRVKVHAVFDIMCESTTAQRGGAFVNASTNASQALAPFSAGNSLAGYGTAAEDTSTAKNVQLTIQLGTANATTDFVAHAATLEVIKKR